MEICENSYFDKKLPVSNATGGNEKKTTNKIFPI